MKNNLEEKAQEISDKFKEFLGHHNKFLRYEIFYIEEQEKFEIEILPKKKGFNSQKYFMWYFETTKGQEELSKFAKENNVGFVRY